jgi:hypothetical protein
VGDSTVRLCGTCEELVKEIDTDPALAVSEVLSNFNWPSELAARLRMEAALEGVLAAGAGAVALDALVVAAGVEELVELFDELPQPAASAPASRSTETVGTRRIHARGAA